MAYILGVTGGIGSGKSEVMAILKKYGFNTLSTDDIAKELMAKGTDIYKALTDAFGTDIIAEDGNIDKEKYSALIYSDSRNTRLSNSIIHPAVWNRVREEAERDPLKKTAVETALPDETFRELCSSVWYVHAPLRVRIDRLVRLRGYSSIRCFDIIGKQLGENDFSMFADHMIENSGGICDVERQIRELLKTDKQEDND